MTQQYYVLDTQNKSLFALLCLGKRNTLTFWEIIIQLLLLAESSMKLQVTLIFDKQVQGYSQPVSLA